MSPIDERDQDQALDAALRRVAAETKPRAGFVTQLRAELNARQAAAGRGASLWERLRPYAGQGALLLALTGLVALALFLTPQFDPRPGQPVASTTATPLPGQPGPALPDALPAGALARLGRGQILSMDAAADGHLAVASSWGICLFDPGLAEEWCRPLSTANNISRVLFSPGGDYLAVAHSDETQGLVAVLDTAGGALLAERAFNIAWPIFPMFPSSSTAWDPSGQPRLAVSEFGGLVSVWDWQADSIAWGPAVLSSPVQDEGQPAALDWALTAQGDSLLALGGKYGLALLDGTSGVEKLRLEPTWQVAPVLGIFGLDLLADGRWLAYSYGSQRPDSATEASVGVAVLELTGWQVTNSELVPVDQQPSTLRWNQSLEQPWLAMDSANSLVQIFESNRDAAASIASRPASPLAWGPGDRLYYVRPEGALGMYDQGQEVFIGLDYSNPPRQIAWQGDERLVSLSSDAIFGWDLPARTVGEIGTVAVNAQPLALTADGRLAAYRLAGEDILLLWNTETNQATARLEGGREIAQAAFSADGSRLVTTGSDGQLIVWDAFNGVKIRAMTAAQRQSAPNQQIDALALSPNGLVAALAWFGDEEPDPESGMSNSVRLDVWDLERAEKVAGVMRPASIHALAWSPDGAKLAAAEGGQLSLWDIHMNRLGSLGPEPYGMLSGETQVTQSSGVNALAWSPDGSLLAAGGGLVTLYDVEKGPPAVQIFSGHRGPVRGLAFHPSGAMLASGSFDGTILVWDLGYGSLPEPYLMPTATPLPGPDGAAPVPTPPDMSQYNLSTHNEVSPDGRWQALVVAGETKAGAAQPGSYHRLRVTGPDGQDFAFEQWNSAGVNQWSELRWWPDAPQAIYWYEKMNVGNPCQPQLNTELHRMDLSSGEVQSVAGLDDSWLGNMVFSPDTAEVAYVNWQDPAGAEIVIRDLISGTEQRAVFTPINTGNWTVTRMVFQPQGGGILLIHQFPPNNECFASMIRAGVVLYEPGSGRVSQQEIPWVMEYSGWQPDGIVVLRDLDGKQYQLNIYNGKLDPSILSPQDEAGYMLWQFANALAAGAQDPDSYAEAAALFGGDWSTLAAQFPETDPADGARLLRQACEAGGHTCLPVKTVTFDSERDGFWFGVVYRGADQQDWSLDGQISFAFHVKKDAAGQYKVMTLPPRAPAADALRSFLDLLSADSEDAYAKAARLYAGSPRAFHSYYPPPTPTDPAAFLRWACTEGGASGDLSLCQKPRALSSIEQFSPNRARIWVQAALPGTEQLEGSLIWVPYDMLRGADEQWRSADLPPHFPGTNNLTVHLPDSETADLDVLDILRALWQDYLEMNKSALLPDGQRLIEFETGDVSLDPRLVNLINEFNLDAVGTVTYSVRPARLEYSNWVAGNGSIGDDGWVRDKALIIGLVRENGVSHLRIMGTGP